MSALLRITDPSLTSRHVRFAPKIGIGGASRLRPSHTTVRTGPYTAVREVTLTRFDQMIRLVLAGRSGSCRTALMSVSTCSVVRCRGSLVPYRWATLGMANARFVAVLPTLKRYRKKFLKCEDRVLSRSGGFRVVRCRKKSA